jgi:hypothetical protein
MTSGILDGLFWLDDGGLSFMKEFIPFYFDEGSVLITVLSDAEERCSD